MNCFMCNTRGELDYVYFESLFKVLICDNQNCYEELHRIEIFDKCYLCENKIEDLYIHRDFNTKEIYEFCSGECSLSYLKSNIWTNKNR